MNRLLAGVLAAAAVACSASESTGVSYAELCAGAPPVRSDGTATMASCPWIQQADNITTYGDTQNGRAMYDGAGTFVGNVASTCDKWAVATDAEGVTIIIQRVSGQVLSHGTVHPGQPISSLPPQLALPLRM